MARSKTNPRERVDWYPGPAALAALEMARRRLPQFRRQDLIDHLILRGAWDAMRPTFALPGTDRDGWLHAFLLQTGHGPARAAAKFRDAFPSELETGTLRVTEPQPHTEDEDSA